MQPENETFLDFSRRTDDLAARLNVNLEDLPQVVGISRASLFCYRTGKRPISGKAWAKLDAAERKVSKSIDRKSSVAEEGPQDPYGSLKTVDEFSNTILDKWSNLTDQQKLEMAEAIIRVASKWLDA